MKNVLIFFWITAISSLLHCTKIYSLPDETQSGAGTFGCRLNGKVWVPTGSDGYSGQNTTRQYSYNGCFFILSAADYDHKPLSALVIGYDSTCVSVGVPLKLARGGQGEGGARYFTISQTETVDFFTNDSITGELTFTKYAPPVTSGIFRFDAINTRGEIIHVTEGRFDVRR